MTPLPETENYLQNWIPFKLVNSDGELLCHWYYTKNVFLNTPFFDDAITRLRGLPQNHKSYKCSTNLDVLEEWSQKTDSVEPAAFVFHVSRCGSTLVAQSFGLCEDFISLSEVPVLDQILRLPYSTTTIQEEKAMRLLKAAIKFYGAKRKGTEKKMILKMDCWHLIFYKQIRALYPDTPFIIMYRNPAEVINSNNRKAGVQGVPGLVQPEVYGISKDDDCMMHPATYFPAVLSRLYDQVLAISQNDNNSLLVNYNEGLNNIMTKITSFANITLTSEERSKIIERSQYNAKYPDEKYIEGNTGYTPAQPLTELNEQYRQIEEFRKRQDNIV